MRLRFRLPLIGCLCSAGGASWAQTPPIDKIDPPGWFAGHPALQTGNDRISLRMKTCCE